MNGLAWLGLLITPEMLTPLLVLAGFLVMFSPTRHWGGGLIVLVLVTAFMPMFEPLFEALFTSMPGWMVLVVVVAVFMSLIGGWRFLRDVLVHVVGDLVAVLFRFLLALPFRILAGIFRFMFRNH